MAEIKIGAGFLDNFKVYLRQLKVSESKIAKVKESEAKDIFIKADKADGNEDGKAEGDKFLEAIKEAFKDENITIDAETKEYLDAWKALAGDDNILETEELSLKGTEETPDTDPSGPSGPSGPTGPTDGDTETPGAVKPVDAASLEGKDSATLRNERSQVLSDIESARSEMETAKAAKQADIDQKKQAYDEALKELAEKSEAKNEKGQSLKDLQTSKTEQEALITAKEGEITQTKSDISTKNNEISLLKSQLSSLKEPSKPNSEEEGAEEAYNKAMADYLQQKADLEQQIRTAEDEVAKLELDLANKEKELQTLNTALDEIQKGIADLIIQIAETETDNKELSETVAEKLIAYATAKEELATATKPFEEKIAQLNANLQTYETAIEKQDAVEAKAKEKWTSDPESEEAKAYQAQIDELLVPEEEEKPEETEEAEKPEETEETEKPEETEETEKPEETEETEKPEENEKQEPNMVLPEKNEEALKTILTNAINDENLSLEDKFRLLNYAKGKNENVVREMLEDDTFFANAFKQIAKDDKYSTDDVLAMQSVYYDLQGNRTITSADSAKSGEVESAYTEGLASLLAKAEKEGKVDNVIKQYQLYGYTPETIKDKINASTYISDSMKAELINSIGGIKSGQTFDDIFDGSVKDYDIKTMNYGGRNYVVFVPKDIDPNEEMPLLIHLHGGGDNSSDKTQSLKDIGIGNGLKHLGKSDYEKPKGIIILPQSHGTWETEQNVEYLDGLVTDFIDNSGYNVNKNKIALAGHSLGTGGAIYYYEHSKNKNLYSRLILESVSHYEDIEKLKNINIPSYIYTGNSDGKNCLYSEEIAQELINKGELKNTKLIKIEAGHGSIQVNMLYDKDKEKDGTSECDKNGNNIPDYFEYAWGD